MQLRPVPVWVDSSTFLGAPDLGVRPASVLTTPRFPPTGTYGVNLRYLLIDWRKTVGF
jgi:hypothetical protein